MEKIPSVNVQVANLDEQEAGFDHSTLAKCKSEATGSSGFVNHPYDQADGFYQGEKS